MKVIHSKEGKGKRKNQYQVTFLLDEVELADSFKKPGPLEAQIENSRGHPNQVTYEVSKELYFRHNLREGCEIDRDQFLDLLGQDQKIKAREVALSQLDLRMRSEGEIEKKLAEKGFGEEVAQETLGFLREYDLVDDEAFAKSYAASRLRNRGHFAIKEELKNKGIAGDLVQDILADFDEDLSEAAQAAALKKVRNLKGRGLSEDKIREKTYRFLLSRGYEYHRVKEAYEAARQEVEED